MHKSTTFIGSVLAIFQKVTIQSLPLLNGNLKQFKQPTLTMTPNKAKNFIQLFNYHIDNHSTGNPKEFATKLGVSRATLYRFITELRDEGISIRFSRSQNSFYIESSTLSELTRLAITQSFDGQGQKVEHQLTHTKKHAT